MSSPPCTNMNHPRTNVKPPYSRLSGDGSASVDTWGSVDPGWGSTALF